MSSTLLATLALLLAASPAAFAETLVVNTAADLPDADLLDGVCDADLLLPGAQVTLRAAVQHANATPGADAITLPAGKWKLKLKGSGEDAAATGDLDVTDDLLLQGEDVLTTVLDAKSCKDRALEVHAGAALELRELTLKGGLATEDLLGGGAVRVDGTLDMSRCLLKGNRSLDDAGAVEFGHDHVGLSTLADSRFEKNKASDDGGAVDVDGGSVDVLRCSFVSNKAADEGGGLEASDAEVTLVNCTFAKNKASLDGGAINVEQGGGASLIHCTLWRNGAVEGAGISVQDELLGTDASARSTLFDNGSANNGEGTVTSGGGNIETGVAMLLAGPGDQSGVSSKLLLNKLSTKLGFLPVCLPKAGSPALDAGDDALAAVIPTDQRGLPRQVDAVPGGTLVDVGAVELQASELAP